MYHNKSKLWQKSQNYGKRSQYWDKTQHLSNKFDFLTNNLDFFSHDFEFLSHNYASPWEYFFLQAEFSSVFMFNWLKWVSIQSRSLVESLLSFVGQSWSVHQIDTVQRYAQRMLMKWNVFCGDLVIRIISFTHLIVT